MEKLNRFLEWAYKTRGEAVKSLATGKMLSKEQMFLSFMSHNPVFISNGVRGLNGAVKGIGFIPKEEYLSQALKEYKEHIKSYVKGDRNYQKRGLELLIKWLYSAEACKNIDFDHLYGIEMAYENSYYNYLNNPECSMVFYQPPVISYEVKGKIELLGQKYDLDSDVENDDLPIIQQFVNAQHDVYHNPNPSIWKTRLVYKFKIEEIYDKSSTEAGFGTRIY